jgi:phosphoglycolate phosphatase-like HAD superfamily hydrolase
MDPWLILFDVDGTLLHTQGAGRKAMERAGKILFGPAFTFAPVSMAGQLDTWIFERAAETFGLKDLPQAERRFREIYIKELEQELGRASTQVHGCPGIPELLTALRDAGVGLGMVTGNYEKAAWLKVAAAGLEPSWFKFNGFAGQAPTRPGLVRLAMESFWMVQGRPQDPRRVVVIGDTPKDVECARANGCRSLGVATGWHSLEELAAAGADAALPNLSRPEPLWHWLGR